ncbi:hypothetical protein I4U23_021761 [Adineta vaga]|nr:hypothetical protein I4U23_021761 [Adineta vaga]
MAMSKTNSRISSDVSMKNDSPLSNKRVIWYYNNNTEDSSNSSWIPFNDIDNEIVENAFSKQFRKVELDDYIVDLDKLIQIDKQDISIKRSIKRHIHSSNETAPLRSERFYTSQKLVKSLHGNDTNDRRFLNKVRKRFETLSTNEKLDKAADGIIQEGIGIGREIEAKWIAEQLHLIQEKSANEIEKCLILLYTTESFLYRLINITLRENDQSKLDTLGPFIELLFHTDCSSSMCKIGYSGELYRGAQLDDETIQSYIDSIGKKKTWDAFSSTSKNRKKAQSFGNVLFIINRDKSTRYKYSGMDVSSISQYPDEEEVLIRASRNFLVENVEKDNRTNKYLIYLSLL